MTEFAYVSPEMTVSFFEDDADVLTASGEAYTGEGDYGDLETRDAGEWDDFDFDWG